MTKAIRICLLFIVLVYQLPAQADKKADAPRYFPVSGVVSSARQIVAALGDRVQKPGKERVVIDGTLSRSGLASTAQVIYEMPGLWRIDETGGKGKSLVFDLTSLKGNGAIDDEDEGLAESIQSDTTETFLTAFGHGASVRHIGDCFKVKGETGFGAEVDIFEVVAIVNVKRAKEIVSKRYMFDSNTGLLRRVAYFATVGGKQVSVQTVLSDYAIGGGYMLPGKISRQVDATVAFTFTRTAATVQAAAKDNAFTSAGR
ncbi:hypothetical protein [Paludibaculum fermentans]|uniref:hypothetical protein n=1 Tax=Paludibaculum fermentans TaxID=1473598 RepID=UPI003EB9AC7E